MSPTVKEFFDPATWTLTYVVFDETTNDAVVIDPVWDYDMSASQLSNKSSEKILEFAEKHNLKIHLILETHAHADHLTAAKVLQKKIPNSKIGIGVHITEVQKVFKKVFNLKDSFQPDGSQFDILMKEDKSEYAGSLKIDTLFTPGHTPACSSFLIGDCVFTGDSLFMPDYGTGRCDFPSGSAVQLYHSIHEKLYKLPDLTRVFTGHDYQPNSRPLMFESSILEQKEKNIHLNYKTTEQEFVNFRETRDKNLNAPKLLFQSLQVNIRAGELPEQEINQSRYLKIPVKER